MGCNGDFTNEIAEFPVVGVPYEYAEAFCSSIGKRLPTEAEWEVAARWNTGAASSRNYPWGGTSSDFKPDLAADNKTYPVGTNTVNVSQFGVHDLAGNAWEYVSGSYDERVMPTVRVLRGGTNDFLRTNSQRIVGDPATYFMSKWAGFRCAADAAAASADVAYLEFARGDSRGRHRRTLRIPRSRRTSSWTSSEIRASSSWRTFNNGREAEPASIRSSSFTSRRRNRTSTRTYPRS